MTYILLLIINILFVYFIKSGKKYWLLSIPLWTILISGFIYWRVISDRHIQNLRTEYEKTFQGKEYGDYGKMDNLEAQEKKAQRKNILFIYSTGFQTFITFILQIIGQKTTKRKEYKWTKLIFAVLFILIFLLIAMMGIVPAGGIVGQIESNYRLYEVLQQRV